MAHVRSRDGAQNQENTPMSPDPSPHERLGSGNKTANLLVLERKSWRGQRLQCGDRTIKSALVIVGVV